MTQPKRLGVMVDCSRNAVMNVPSLKRFIDLLSQLGYNTLLMYMEDTYEVDNQPYFGYMRGRYSRDELREIDAYAAQRGLEVIPCIQALAHMNALADLPAYRELIDCDDILMIDDERVYGLIEDMFSSLSKCFRTKHINIGMDEAHMVGRGKYYDLHGDTDKTQLLLRHVERVARIGAKYGYSLSMWSDMFFRIAFRGDYYNAGLELSEDVKALIPDNVELIYWDYYSKEQSRYDYMLKAHAKIQGNTWFAGGFWTWCGFAPCNRFSISATQAALAACADNGVDNVIFTLWGDDTAECSKFATIPSLFYVAEYVRGNRDDAAIKAKFADTFGIDFDAFLLLDLTAREEIINPSKYVLYNDPFTGLMDKTITPQTGEEHRALAEKLAAYESHGAWGYLFTTLRALCDVVALKADLGLHLRQAYEADDRDSLRRIVAEMATLSERLEAFYAAFERQWMGENKPHGFDVQDIRLGGLMRRVAHCTARLEQYLAGDLDRIEELEETQLDYFGGGADAQPRDSHLNSFKNIFTTNTFSW